MNTTEELLRETLHRHVHDAPLVTSYQSSRRPSPRFPARWGVSIAAIVVTAAVVGGVAWVDRQNATSELAPAAPTTLERVEGLTGPAVAEVLGLRGEPDTKAELTCATTVAVALNAVRYCLDGVTSDPAERMVIGWQIGGIPATPSRLPYARALVELVTALETTDADDPSLYQLENRVRELKAAAAQEMRALRNPAAAALRGTRIDALTCRNPLGTEPGKPVASLAVTTVTGEPSQLVVCGPDGQQISTLTTPDDDRFTALLDALTLPDLPSTSSSPCPAIAIFYPPVLLQTSEGSWLLHQPQGNCGAPRPKVLQAVATLLHSLS